MPATESESLSAKWQQSASTSLRTFYMFFDARQIRQHYMPDELFAEAYIGLGEKDEAMARLERAYEEHDQGMFDINAYPGWDVLRSEPRFQALLRRMNFRSS